MKYDAEKAQLAIAKLIRAVVLSSAAIILIGLIMYLITGVSGYDNNEYPTNPLLILSDIMTLKPYAIMLTGLFILILTPVLRVGVSIILFIKEKDKLYVAITSFVFIVLIISFILGKVE